MPLIPDGSSALPHIDAAPSSEALATADALIQTELSSEDQNAVHPAIPTQSQPHFSDLVEAEHMRIEEGQSKDGGIDLSRYEALDAPEKGDLDAWKATFNKAYASAEYLHGREINLGLLEAYGKNSWLIGNSQLEDILRSLEKEVEDMKLEQEAVEQARRSTQSNVAGEMQNPRGWMADGCGKDD